jgi:uncharacterized cofD-like protein
MHREDQHGPAVVAFGGGTGLPVLLRGLRNRTSDLTAVVTVADDGGSSGRLRDAHGISPPGDLRNCLVALARRRELAELFEYRFRAGVELRDHSLGNIVIAALADMSGGFGAGVERAAELLEVTGRVIPAAEQSLTLVVSYADGGVTRGEAAVGTQPRGPVASIAVEPAGTAAPRAALDAIRAADVVVLSAGSLFTSTIASLLGEGVQEAIAGCGCPVVYVSSLMTQPGETDGFTVADHLDAIARHVGPIVTDVVVNTAPLPGDTVLRYGAEGAAPVTVDRDAIEALGVRVHEAELAAEAPTGELRHDTERLVDVLLALTR